MNTFSIIAFITLLAVAQAGRGLRSNSKDSQPSTSTGVGNTLANGISVNGVTITQTSPAGTTTTTTMTTPVNNNSFFVVTAQGDNNNQQQQQQQVPSSNFPIHQTPDGRDVCRPTPWGNGQAGYEVKECTSDSDCGGSECCSAPRCICIKKSKVEGPHTTDRCGNF